MTVNFTGIKNVGYERFADRYRRIQFQLTNDEDGNDYDKYEKVLARTDRGDRYKNQNGPEFVYIEVEPGDKGYIRVNGKSLPAWKENIPLIKFLAKVTDRISKKRELDLDKGYIEGDLKEKTVFGKDYYYATQLSHDVFKTPDSPDEYFKEMMEEKHKPDVVKDGARKVSYFLSGVIYNIHNMKYKKEVI